MKTLSATSFLFFVVISGSIAACSSAGPTPASALEPACTSCDPSAVVTEPLAPAIPSKFEGAQAAVVRSGPDVSAPGNEQSELDGSAADTDAGAAHVYDGGPCTMELSDDVDGSGFSGMTVCP